MENGSYLDDPDHIWELDPTVTAASLKSDILHLAKFADDAGIELVLRGYFGLKQRFPNATDGQCFSTSMIWYFG